MAKLYPPIIEGSLPAFCSNNGTVNITVPFSMNKAVSANSIEGFSLKIKTVSSNTYLLSFKWLLDGNGITDTVINECDQLFTSSNQLKDKEILKSLLITWLGNYCLDLDSINNLIKVIFDFQNEFLDLKLTRENKAFREQCIINHNAEINLLKEEQTSLANQIQTIENNIDDAQSQIIYLMTRKQNLESLIPQKRMQIAEWEAQLNTINPEDNAAYDALMSEIREANRELNEYNEELASIPGQIDNYEAQITYFNEIKDDKVYRKDTVIPAEIVRLEQEIKVFQLELVRFENNISYLETMLRNLLNNTISSIESIIQNNSISFCIFNPVDLVVGQHYKFQLAYLEKDTHEVGYYSTVGIAKYTTYPDISIAGLNENELNLYQLNFTGHYDQTGKDITEKVYNYQFNLYQNNKLSLSSGWLLHNSTYDDSISSSFDSYSFEKSINPNINYQLEYRVKTINNLEVATPLYDIILQEALTPESNIEIKSILNFDNAYIDLFLNTNNDISTGAFIISRTDNKSNYSDWITLMNLSLNNNKIKDEFIYRDYCIEHGVTYIYAIQQYNSKGLFSKHIKANPIFADFEDAFLYDGEKQLKIKFNPKVTSLKQTMLESKTDTIGGKYPFIFRNPRVSYKEFPISGLISYHSDEEELFLTEQEYNLVEKTTNLTGENIGSERFFKTAVLNWLINGEKKLFKSPGEGNFIVRLMNVTLSPNDTLNRMLHTFNCNAYEIADFNYQNCKDLGFIKVNDLSKESLVYRTVDLSVADTGDLDEPFIINPEHNVYSIEFNTNANIPVIINDSTYYTNNDGYLKIQIDGVIFKAGTIMLSHGISYDGTATYSYYGIPDQGFSNIKSINIKTVPLRQIINAENILEQLQDIKTEILSFNYIKAYTLEQNNSIYSITINNQRYDFLGGEELYIENIIEPKSILASSPDIIVECGYQCCEKTYNIEEEENDYLELYEILNKYKFKKKLNDYNEARLQISDAYFIALQELHQNYINGSIVTETEYQNRLEEIQNTYRAQAEMVSIENAYNELIKRTENNFEDRMQEYLILLENKLNKGAI